MPSLTVPLSTIPLIRQRQEAEAVEEGCQKNVFLQAHQSCRWRSAQAYPCEAFLAHIVTLGASTSTFQVHAGQEGASTRKFSIHIRLHAKIWSNAHRTPHVLPVLPLLASLPLGYVGFSCKYIMMRSVLYLLLVSYLFQPGMSVFLSHGICSPSLSSSS